MITEIGLSLIIIGFLTLVITLVLAVRSLSKKLAQVQKDLHNLATQGSDLIDNLNELTEDIKKKSKSLNFIFQFIDEFNKKSESGSQKDSEKVAEIVSLIGTSINLINRISGDIKKYVKSR